jgi:hypothetical protein
LSTRRNAQEPTNGAFVITSFHKDFRSGSSGAIKPNQTSSAKNMEPSISPRPSGALAAYIGVDWADQKHAIALRSAAEPSKVHHQVVEQKPEALMEWIGQLEQRFGAQGKILICLEQSRGALIYHLMGYEFFELYRS